MPTKRKQTIDSTVFKLKSNLFFLISRYHIISEGSSGAKMKNKIKFLILVLFSAFFSTYILFCYVNDEQAVLLPKFSFVFNRTETCGRYPKEEDLLIDNTIWQVLDYQKGFVKILNAYLDTRPDRGVNSTVIRLNVISKMLNESDIFYCQFWFDGKPDPTVVNATEVLSIF